MGDRPEQIALDVRDLRKAFGGVRAVDGCSFASCLSARVVFRLARASIAFPSNTSATMMMTAS